MTTSDGVAVVGTGPVPRPLRNLPKADVEDLGIHRRLVVTGGEAELAAVLSALLRADRLDVEVAAATGQWSARRALRAAARRVPLIRDETGTVLVSAAQWHGLDGAPLQGEAIVDDVVLFDGEACGVRVEPTTSMPGLRASVLSDRGRPRRWVAGRAAQLGTPGAQVIRDGVPAPRTVRRSTFYRHTEGWLRVG
ncbi:hypothetical protein [Mycolicibacterium fortuitum]|uniref:hypothetical protein n=1 Tax=Mycolicibacterium fortuitum TaxID=1766 RepID=UPI0007EAC6D5|nr:hypothetical protein [Mycolicibacterium fortuitum]OBB53365.1 hypothetical protein A5754_20520 [Mycolicibacterium fortuitum]OBB58840.1 hypothetical protein A5755_26780 [Mycolicibacterium fortuitum]OBF74972.1 hypothetical protein A5751_01195 [Mycolicibacterium fortuitum]OBI76741.1 hypothetical protein A5664_21705 [Mycolicibacterium fortuitum]